MKVKLYLIDNNNNPSLLELYKDESIKYTSKLSDIEKLSNVFADFSNTFTVPATPKNNAIFKHYYDVDIDNTFNANIRALGYIEIDSFPFRYGKIQLESIKLINQKPDSYKITFYGGVIQLNDLFKDDTIDKLDYQKDITGSLVKTWDSLSQFDYEYNSGNFINSINLPTFKSGSIITPLISYTDRDWNYGSADSIDISGSTGAILDSELRPAIRVKHIIEGIETKYGINFSRNFLDTAAFNNLFMWMNAQSNAILGAKTEVTITTPLSGSPNAGNISEVDNFIYISRQKYSQIAAVEYIARLDYEIVPSNPLILYNAYLIDENGIEVKKWENLSGTNTLSKEWKSEFRLNGDESLLVVEQVKLLIEPQQTLAFNLNLNATYKRKAASVITVYTDLDSNTNTNLISVSIIISNNLPKMKVIDFLQGIMKMFKLIIRPLSSNEFYLDTLDSYYSNGKLLNLTNYVNQNEINVERPLIYKNIEFKFQKTNNIAGEKYRKNNDPNDEIGYGDLKSEYSSIETKDELKVELPFENMLFERMTVLQPNASAGSNTNITIGQSISSNDNGVTFSRNNSKPILFFNNGLSNNEEFPFKIKFSNSSAVTVSYSYLIGNTNDEFIDQVTDTINWGAEVDPWHQQIVANSLYLNYWSNWINTIYSLKQRKFTYNAILPPRYIEELSLNDRIIIGNNRYKINDYEVDLTTGETKFTLFNDIYLWNKYSFPKSQDKEFTSYQFTPTGSVYITDFNGANNDSYYIYGNFTSYSGSSANRIIKLKNNGEIDTTFNYGTGLNSNPFAFSSIYVYPNDDILLTGFFTQYSGSTSNRIVKVKANGTKDTTFNEGAGFNNYTCKPVINNSGNIFVVGNFTSYSGSSANRIIKLNSNGTRDTSFNIGSGLNNAGIDTLLNNDGTLLVTGYFTSYSGSTSNKIVKINPNGTKDTTFREGAGFNTGTNEPNGILPTIDGKILAYGYFTQYSGSTSNRIVKINQNGTIDTSFMVGSGFNNIVGLGKVVLDNKYLFTGAFTSYNGISSNKAIILNNDGTIYKTYPVSNLAEFIINDNYYNIDNLGSLNLENESFISEITTNDIITNPGSKYYGINLITSKEWNVEKIDYGFGTSWVDILTEEGIGSSEIVIKTKFNPNETSRVIGIKINVLNIETIINITQNGL
jgi:uncharacterized delta-60 repeat protein